MESAAGLGLIRALGARDLVIGALILRSGDDRGRFAQICRWATLAACTDAIAVASARGLCANLALHAGGALGLMLAASQFGEGTDHSNND